LSVENKWAKLITVPIASLISILFGFVDFLRGIIRPIDCLSMWCNYMGNLDGMGNYANSRVANNSGTSYKYIQ
jgi:hypothetical protein